MARDWTSGAVAERAAADKAAWAAEQERRATKLDPREPRRDPLHPMFRDHNCSYCRSGELPCREGSPSRCSNPMARND